MLLENLSPQQRAAFLLREVFQYAYPEVARITGTDVDTTRHLVARARKHLRRRRPRYHATRRQHRQLALRFFAAVEHGDLPALEELLAQHVAMHGDGGGKVPALGQPVRTAARGARPGGDGAPAGPCRWRALPPHRGQRPARRAGLNLIYLMLAAFIVWVRFGPGSFTA
ncbi:sigma factor-like helix-turn-helix DNA-binding protein [Microbispora siamensis]